MFNRVVAICLLFAFPVSLANAAASGFDRNPLIGFQHSAAADRQAAIITQFGQKYRTQHTLRPSEWQALANAEESFAIEHSRIGNIKRADDWIRVNLAQLKKGRSTAEQAALDQIANDGLYSVLYRTAQLFRAQVGEEAFILPGARFVPASYHLIPVERLGVTACNILFHSMEAIALPLGLDPFTAPLGVILGISAILGDMLLRYDMAC